MDFNDLDPHLNAEGYRNHHPTNLLENQIDFVDFNKDGNMLLGCSSLTGRYWNGSLYYCPNVEEAPDNAVASLKCETGVVEGFFLGGKRIIVAEDSGVVAVCAIINKEDHITHRPLTLSTLSSTCEHDDTINSLSVFSDLTHAVTGGSDKNIKVFDIETLLAEHTYRPAHRKRVTSVCAKPEAGNHQIFASSSLDGYVLLWDTRKSKPAMILMKDTSVEFSALAWHLSEPDTLAIGSNLGKVSLVDTRQLIIDKGSVVREVQCFERPIHRLRFAPHCHDWLAVTANDTPVKVFDCSSDIPKVIYCDDRHNDFARGLAWHPISNQLVSTGWDRKVYTHAVDPSSTNMDAK